MRNAQTASYPCGWSYILNLPVVRRGYADFWKGEPPAEFANYWTANAYESARQLAAEIAAIEPDAPREIDIGKRVTKAWTERLRRCEAFRQLQHIFP
jgi:predicted YcjX-like family ATPase